MDTAESAYLVMPIWCSHCQQEQIVHVRSKVGFAPEVYQNVSCVKCKQDFDVWVPDKIVDGPFLP